MHMHLSLEKSCTYPCETTPINFSTRGFGGFGNLYAWSVPYSRALTIHQYKGR